MTASPDHPRSTEPIFNDRRGFPAIWPLLFVAFGALALLAPAFVHHVGKVEVDASIEVFTGGAESESDSSFDKLEAMLSDSEACMVLARFDDIFSDAGADRIDRIGKSLAAIDGIPSVFSLTRAKRPVRKDGFSLDPRNLIEFAYYVPKDGRTPEEWSEIRESVLDFPWARDLLISSDGRWAMWIAEIARDLPDHEARVALRGQVAEALESYRAEVDELHFSGFAFIEAEVREDVEQDVTRFLFALPVLLALVFLITFRSFQVFFAVLAFEVMGIASLPVLVNLNGFTLNLYTGILLPLVAGLQLTFLTHLFASLRWWHRRGLVFKDALAVALFHVFKPAAIAALTTGIGLLSLLTCDVGLVREFGLLGAQAVGAAFLVTFLPVYLLSRFVLRGVAQHELDAVVGQGGVEDSWRDGPLDRLVQAAVRKRRWILGLTLLLVLGTIPAMGRLRTDLRAMEFLSPEGESRITMGLIDVEMGGMNLFELVIDSGEDGGIQDPATMRYLEKVENYGRELDGVSNVYGYAQLFAVMNQIWSHDAPGTRRVPEDAGLIKAMELVVSGEKFLFGDQIFDKERRRTTMFLRTRDMRASKYLALLKDFIGYAEEHAPAGVVLDGKAGIHSVLESDRRIVGSQTRSLAICGLVVFITLSILWRSLLTALIAVLVNLPALAVVLALHGYGGIPLNSVTVMVGAVVLGIAVDNCIHVLSFWNEERQRGLGVEEAVRRVIAKKIGAMTCTTAVLVGGLGFFLFSSFPPVSDFGGLALVALTVALIATVFLLPPMIVVMVRDKATSK